MSDDPVPAPPPAPRLSIVIGSSREQKLPSLVLEHTIKKYASQPIRVIHTYDMTFPTPASPKNRSRTGFSFARFAIPALVGFSGHAAYLECDQIVLEDPVRLLSLPFEGATVLRTRKQTSVLVLDCDRLRWDVADIVARLDGGWFTYKGLMENLCVEPSENISATIPQEWNSLEKYVPGETCLLHYTEMDLQPWRKWWPHPLKSLWLKELKAAVRAGLVTLDLIRHEVDRKYIVPQILEVAKTWAVPSTP